MSSDLAPGQFELDARLTFGKYCKVVLNKAPQVGEPDIVDQDTAREQSDGVLFGVDQRGSRTLTFDLTSNPKPGDDVDALCDEVEGAWLADDVRSVPGAWSVLRYAKPSGLIKRVYGRARKIAPVEDYAWTGRVDWTAEFATRDHRFFEDELHTVSVHLVPPEDGGLVVPFTLPVATVRESASSELAINIGGSIKTPVTLRVYGPISQPVVQVVNHWTLKLNGTIASDDYVEIDPVQGSALSRFGKNWAGAFTQDSPVFEDMMLPPGTTFATLRGTDNTGSAHMDVMWRNASPSF